MKTNKLITIFKETVNEPNVSISTKVEIIINHVFIFTPSIMMRDVKFEIRSEKEYVLEQISEVAALEEKAKRFRIIITKEPTYFYYSSESEMLDVAGSIYTNYISGVFNCLHVKGAVVINIGAFIGDTAIYFATQGAEKVYAYEPYPKLYKIAKNNIHKNKLDKKVLLFNAAVGGESGTIVIENSISAGSTNLRATDKGISIPIISLSSLIKKIGKKRLVLESNCEGGEYDILLNTPLEVLALFDEMFVQYHRGCNNLVEKLKEAGFEITFIGKPGIVYDYGDQHTRFMGNIYARR